MSSSESGNIDRERGRQREHTKPGPKTDPHCSTRRTQQMQTTPNAIGSRASMCSVANSSLIRTRHPSKLLASGWEPGYLAVRPAHSLAEVRADCKGKRLRACAYELVLIRPHPTHPQTDCNLREKLFKSSKKRKKSRTQIQPLRRGSSQIPRATYPE